MEEALGSPQGALRLSQEAADFKQWAHLENEVWRDYRIRGANVTRNTHQKEAIYQNFDLFGAPPPLNPDSLRFFENWRWRPSRYLFGHDSGAGLGLDAEFDDENVNPNTRPAMIRARYREVKDCFGQPRFAVQKVLGIGGNGMATHFKDHGPGGEPNPGRDFVVKVSLGGWQSFVIEDEKRMMRKVKGSAHCVQMIEPQDIGMPEEEPAVLPIPYFDSSTDGDSSGNESLSRAEVLTRHRKPKRRDRSARYNRLKKKRREARGIQIIQEINRQRENNARKDYIIMEYLDNGSLAVLLRKLNEHEREDGFPYRIPNRVLWGFWLCLIRACIAMEYPPRKTHPLRKKPRTTSQLAVDYVRAKGNKMLRECRALGIRILGIGERQQLEDEEEEREAEYQRLKGDLIEDCPAREGEPDEWKLERRQNMIHRDFDPTNVFVNGFELDKSRLKSWQSTRKYSNEGVKSDGQEKEFNYTSIRPDRVWDEHGLVPRLKLGDFGASACIKREKTNEYYFNFRGGGKMGDHPPEYFGPEWETIDPEQKGDELADSRRCGYYSNKTNIWGAALTMWQLITKFVPPIPPQPQPPYDQVDNYPVFNQQGQTDMDLIFNNPEYADFKISYCTLLRDPIVEDYDWVDERLRETIFKCMYHRPDDRPSLGEILREAERNVELDISGEPDERIRQWIQYWFFDAPIGYQKSVPPGGEPDVELPPPLGGQPPVSPSEQPPAPPSAQPPTPLGEHPPAPLGEQPPAPLGEQPPAPPGGQSNKPPEFLAGSPIPSSAEPGLPPVMQQRLIKLNADFPHGYDRVPNSASGSLCGLIAIVDSLKYQLGLNPTIHGVTHHLNSLPTVADLRTMHANMLATGAFGVPDYVLQEAPDITALSNLNIDVLSTMLQTWGRQMNLELELVCKVRGKSNLVFTGSIYDNPKSIYIWNDNNQEVQALLGKTDSINHYEGLKPKPAPSHEDDYDDLPDYESE